MWHLLALEMEELAQFLGAQFGPMSHTAAAILPGSLGKYSDHEQCRQGVLPTTAVTMIGDRAQIGIECLQIKHERFLGKGELAQKCCIVHRRTFHEYNGIVSSIYTQDGFILFPTLQQPCPPTFHRHSAQIDDQDDQQNDEQNYYLCHCSPE